MSAFLEELTEAQARSWPDDQRYQCRCSACGGLFFGPKRAHLCWPHWEARGAALEARKQAMIAEYGPYEEWPPFPVATPITRERIERWMTVAPPVA